MAPGQNAQVTVVLAAAFARILPRGVRIGLSPLQEHGWVAPDVQRDASSPAIPVESVWSTPDGVQVSGLSVCGDEHGPVAAVVHYSLHAARTEDALAGLTVEPGDEQTEPPALCLLRGLVSGSAGSPAPVQGPEDPRASR